MKINALLRKYKSREAIFFDKFICLGGELYRVRALYYELWTPERKERRDSFPHHCQLVTPRRAAMWVPIVALSSYTAS
jgi:hypothetical protein